MEVPALRQPKFTKTGVNTGTRMINTNQEFVIVTLRDETKLVITSDAYNGILTVGQTYECVFCGSAMELNEKYKRIHVNSTEHKKLMRASPYVELFSEHLVRQTNKDNYYCSICNVIAKSAVTRHISTDAHKNELQKAKTRSTVYKPCNE